MTLELLTIVIFKEKQFFFESQNCNWFLDDFMLHFHWIEWKIIFINHPVFNKKFYKFITE